MAGSLTDGQTDAIAADFDEFTEDMARALAECTRMTESYLATHDDQEARQTLRDLTAYQQEIPRIRKGIVWFRSAPAGADGSKEAAQFGKAFDWILATLETGVALRDRAQTAGETAAAA